MIEGTSSKLEIEGCGTCPWERALRAFGGNDRFLATSANE